MQTKKILAFIILAMILMMVSETEALAPAKKYVQVYYFHGDRRCKTCNTIEKYTKDAVNNNFDKKIKSGIVKLDIVNFDKDDNEHYINKFSLYNQALIVAIYENGEIKRWKNLEKIWEYVSNPDKYENYVESEINKYLQEL